MSKSPYFFLLLIAILCSCKNTNTGIKDSIEQKPQGNLRYAEKFSMSEIGPNILLTVFSPWQNASEASFQYLLGNKQSDIPDSLEAYTYINTPVRSAIIMSTTFLSFIDTLGEMSSITGVSGGQYAYNNELRREIDAGKVRDIGFDQSLNYEVIVDLNPDVVFMFGVQTGIIQTVNKLKEFNIPVVLCADYLEPHPLGRAEWLKFFSAFYGKLALGSSIFNGIADSYNSVAQSGKEHLDGPKVMLGLPWKDTWYVAGGSSYAARLIEDAGGRYVFGSLDNQEALPMDIEGVFYKCLDADVWINPGVAGSLEEILEHDPRFENFQSFKQGKVFSNAKRMGETGGNDYWESGILHPDVVLKDLSIIFGDTLIDEDALHYYFQLN